MKSAITIFFFVSITVASAQTGFTGIWTGRDVVITIRSSTEPPGPPTADSFTTGIGSHVKRNGDGIHRFLYDLSTYVYFGYDMLVERIPATGDYRVTFNPLSATPADLHWPDSGNWKLIPAPTFPEPQVVHPREMIAVDLLQNPRTGQKLIDYIRVDVITPQCSGQEPGRQNGACLSSLLEDANRVLAYAVDSSARRHGSREASIRRSQLTWSQYRTDACHPMWDETERLRCELTLTNGRIDEINKIY